MILEFPCTLPSEVCEDILEMIPICEKMRFTIPTKNAAWKRIENILYKQLQKALKTCRAHAIENLHTEEGGNILTYLNSDLKTHMFHVQSHTTISDDKFARIASRYNCFHYVFFINNIDGGGDLQFRDHKIVNHEQGKLLIFHDQENFAHTMPLSEQVVISGQLFVDKVI